jgi:chemotaxis protein methyltransferase CheR
MGEEPYTIAMVFEELGAAGRSHIVATDIARGRLEDAQRGIYSKWQLRSTSEPLRRRYFTERGKYFELTPRIRKRVDFRYLNLSEDSFPSMSTGVWGMDVIFCRNVLIYFDAPTVERVARRLIASLSETGFLFLGASDPAIADMVECDVVMTDAGLVYRRRGAGGPADIRTGPETFAEPLDHTTFRIDTTAAMSEDADPAVSAETWPPPADPWNAPAWETHATGSAYEAPDQPTPATPAAMPAESALSIGEEAIAVAYAARDFDRVQTIAESLARQGSLSTAASIAWVRSLANGGRIAEAGETVIRAMDEQGAAPELLYLHAVLLLQSGRSADAAAAARRALYMDRSLVVAHLTLAEAQRRGGNMVAARRALRNATSLLTALDPSAIVPASDGETAGRLTELVQAKLKLLGEEERE